MPGFPLEEWDEIADLVEAALDEPPDRRATLLDQLCTGDPGRLEQARRALAAAERAAGFLNRPAAELTPAVVDEAVADLSGGPGPPPAHVGPYRILKQLGRGGMGDVYLAARDDDQYRREVAIKVVRASPGADLAARFRHERQVLASLDHPHIARLYDGGVMADGRPYLVMERVDGRPLDRYIEERQPPLAERLLLFDQICDAVIHAHRSLVVHRDLKPGNILVTDEGTVKLLDFGVAKLLDTAPAAGNTPVTRAGMRVMTPEYASPEQFRGEPVTTATDVYALGVLLFEILTGQRPHRRAEGSPADLERAVVNDDAERPSAVAHRRAASGSNAAPDARALRGDLDTIVGHALERDPRARYGSVDAVRADVRAYLDGEPIAARPATLGYRAAKFVRRHRLGVGAAAAILVVAIAGIAATVLQARAVAREGQRASQIRDFLIGVFEHADPDRAAGETLTARELLERGAARLERELAGQPDLSAEMAGVLGAVMQRLGLYEPARGQLQRALELRRSTEASPEQLGASLEALAGVLINLAEYDQAEPLLREAIAIGQERQGPSSPLAASATLSLAAVHRLRGHHEAAEPLYRDALGVHRALGDRAAVARSLNGLAINLSAAGKPGDAVVLLHEAVALRRALHGDRHTDVAESVCNLGHTLHLAGQLDEAVEAFNECLDIRRVLLGPDHPAIGMALNNLAMVYSTRQQFDRVEPLLLESLAIRRKAYGDRHPDVAGSLNNLAVQAYMRGNYGSAASRFREVLAVWIGLVGADHPDAMTTANNLGMALKESGDIVGATSVLEDNLTRRRRVLGPVHPAVAESLMNLGGLFEGTGEFARAAPLLEEALAQLDERFPDGHQLTSSAAAALGRVRHRQGRFDAALTHLQRAVMLRAKLLGDNHARTADARLWLGRCLTALGRRDEAIATLTAAQRSLTASGDDSSAAREVEAALDAARQ